MSISALGKLKDPDQAEKTKTETTNAQSQGGSTWGGGNGD